MSVSGSSYLIHVGWISELARVTTGLCMRYRITGVYRDGRPGGPWWTTAPSDEVAQQKAECAGISVINVTYIRYTREMYDLSPLPTDVVQPLQSVLTPGAPTEDNLCYSCGSPAYRYCVRCGARCCEAHSSARFEIPYTGLDKCLRCAGYGWKGVLFGLIMAGIVWLLMFCK